MVYTFSCLRISDRQASSLDPHGECSGRVKSLQHRLLLRTQLYSTPEDPVDRAAKIIEQVHTGTDMNVLFTSAFIFPNRLLPSSTLPLPLHLLISLCFPSCFVPPSSHSHTHPFPPFPLQVSSSADKATVPEDLRSILVKAGELLAPDCFKHTLARPTERNGGKLSREQQLQEMGRKLKDYELMKQQVEEHTKAAMEQGKEKERSVLIYKSDMHCD